MLAIAWTFFPSLLPRCERREIVCTCSFIDAAYVAGSCLLAIRAHESGPHEQMSTTCKKARFVRQENLK